MTTVVNLTRESFTVYIGRANRRYGLPQSKWANPFIIGKDGTREQVVEKYRAYVLGRPDLLASLGEIRGEVMGCWCVPSRCHGHVLLELLEEGQDGS